MNYLFAPSESRAQNFLRDNHFGLDDRANIRLSYHDFIGEKYTEADTLYVLDGCPPKMLADIQANVLFSRRAPRTISVEER